MSPEAHCFTCKEAIFSKTKKWLERYAYTVRICEKCFDRGKRKEKK